MFKFSVLKAAVNNFILCLFFQHGLFCDFFVLNKAGDSFVHGRLKILCMGLGRNNVIQCICVVGVVNILNSTPTLQTPKSLPTCRATDSKPMSCCMSVFYKNDWNCSQITDSVTQLKMKQGCTNLPPPHVPAQTPLWCESATDTARFYSCSNKSNCSQCNHTDAYEVGMNHIPH